MTSRRQKHADRLRDEAAAVVALLGSALGDYADWHAKLQAWADGAPFPSGGSGPSGRGGHSDPTARAALVEDATVHALTTTDRDYADLAAALRTALGAADRLGRQRAWVVNPAKPPDKPHLIFCENAKCQERVRDERGERAYDGLCPRCHKWRSRYGRDYPMREVVGRDAG